MHFKMADKTKKKSQQYTKDSQVHSILKQLITHFSSFTLLTAIFLSSNDANKTDYSIILNHHWEIKYGHKTTFK